MLHDVWTKTLRDQRRGLVAWSVALVLLIGMYVSFYSSMRHSAAYSDLMNQLPQSLRDLFSAGGGADLTSGASYVYMEVLSFVAPTLLLLFTVGAAAQATAGEEERHTLDLLLATPVSRTRVLLQKAAAIGLGVLALVAVMAVALIVLGSAARMGLSTPHLIAAMVHLALLAGVIGSLSLLVGAGTGSVAMARAVGGAIAVVGFLVNGVGASVSWVAPVRKVSPFYSYIGHDPLRHGLSVASLVVAGLSTAVLVAAAVWAFRRRDLAA